MRYRVRGYEAGSECTKFLQGGRARGESWSGNLRRQWRDPEPNRPAVRCGDSMKSW